MITVSSRACLYVLKYCSAIKISCCINVLLCSAALLLKHRWMCTRFTRVLFYCCCFTSLLVRSSAVLTFFLVCRIFLFYCCSTVPYCSGVPLHVYSDVPLQQSAAAALHCCSTALHYRALLPRSTQSTTHYQLPLMRLFTAKRSCSDSYVRYLVQELY